MTREKSVLFDILNYRRIILNKKYLALCLICQKTLRNTAESRLKSHRRICHENWPKKIKTTQESETATVIITSTSSSMKTTDTDNDVNGEYVISDTNELIPLPLSTSKTSVPNKSRPSVESDDDENCDDPDNPDFVRMPKKRSPTDGTLQSYFRSFSSFDSFVDESTASVSDNNYWSSSNSSSTSASLMPVVSSSNQISTKSNKITSSRSFRSKSKRNYVDILSEIKMDDITEKLCNFFYGCNIPFAVVESVHFRAFVQSLNSAYAAKLFAIVDRKKLANEYLDIAYKKCQNTITEFKDRDAVLLIDGWRNSSANTKNIVTVLHSTKGNRAFLHAWNSSSIGETADFLQEIVEKCVITAKERFGANIFAVISDNASDMVCMGHKIDLWHYTCNSHTANLLAKNISNSFSGLLKKILKILKAFADPGVEEEIVKEGGHEIYLPVDTRWNTYRDACLNLKKNLPFMKKVICSDKAKLIEAEIKCLLRSNTLLPEMDEFLELLEPIRKLIDTCQGANVSVSAAVNLWMNLKVPEKFGHLKPDYDQQRNMALNKYSLCSFFLDPIYYETVLKLADPNNKDLDAEEKTYYAIVQSFLLDVLSADGITSFYDYLENRGIFKILREKKIEKANVFWKCAAAEPEHEELSNLGIKMHLLPACTAMLKGSLNQFYIHNQERNRLTLDQSEKLMFVYNNLKLRDIKTSDY